MVEDNSDKIAIIGMACMFPAAGNLREYWQLIRSGQDAITDIPPTHWNPSDYYDPDPRKPDMTYARRGGFLKPYAFDPLQFGMAPHAIEATDTSQLLGMVVAHEALMDAGYGPKREFDRDRVSCVVGVTGTLELVVPLSARLGHPVWRRALLRAGIPEGTIEQVIGEISSSYVGWQESSFPGLLGNVVAGRIANRLNLGGTNAVVDAACGSSLGALHMAMLELGARRADMVVTGGVDTFNDIFMYMCFSKTPALSPTGDARPFATDADGTILGEGVGLLVLKRLADALAAGDRIYAVISGIGTSSDGKGQAIYAPSPQGQAKALSRAYEQAGVTPDQINLLEGHGTGTRAGDATEIAALNDVYRGARSDGCWCTLGSVKAQIGHTKAAAGAAGLIKTALALHYKVLPGTIKVREPMAALADSPFHLHAEAQPWIAPPTGPRRAGVSSFGFGGSNFHCVLEEAPGQPASPPYALFDEDLPVILAWSHENIEGLRALVRDFATHLSDGTDMRRKAAQSCLRFDPTARHRLTVVCRTEDLLSLAERLAAAAVRIREGEGGWATPDGMFYGTGAQPGRLALLFPGQGAQRPGMLRDLAHFPEVMAALDEAARLFGTGAGQSTLSHLIYPGRAHTPEAAARQQHALRETAVAQLAIGAVSAGVLDVLRRFGLRPDMVGGHSFGELTALYAAGVYDRRTLLELALLRGRSMANAAAGAPPSGMAALHADEAMVRNLLGQLPTKDLWIANLNGPSQTVVGGTFPSLDLLEKICANEGTRCQRLRVSAAFHSPLIAPALEPFAAGLAAMRLCPPELPVYANATAAVYPADPGAVRDLLVAQIVQPVRFADEIAAMRAEGAGIMVEVGPSAQISGLCSALWRSAPDGATPFCLAVDTPGGAPAGMGMVHFARLLAQLAALGVRLDLAGWDPLAKESTAVTVDPPGPRFTVNLCGANFRAPTGTPHESQRLPDSTLARSPQSDPSMGRRPTPSAMTLQPKEAIGMKQDPLTSPGSEALQRALERSQENLLAMQKMLEENAAIHKKFLEGQAQSQQMFFELVRMQQGLLRGASFDAVAEDVGGSLSSAPLPCSPPAAEMIASPAGEPGARRIMEDAEGMTRTPVMAVSPERAAPAAVKAAEQSQAVVPSDETSLPGGRAALHATLVEVLSAKTGYPVEMIKDDMDFETDLGIDSIKRVEIFAAWAERMPSFAALSPAATAGLRTIAELLATVEPVAQGSPPNNEARQAALTELSAAGSDAPDNSATSCAQPFGDRMAVERCVIEVIAAATGYPPAMLGGTMHLENDLGIDSIKRVEIFSTLGQQLGAAAVHESNRSAGWSTIADIVDGMMSATGGPAVRDEPAAADPSAALPALARMDSGPGYGDESLDLGAGESAAGLLADMPAAGIDDPSAAVLAAEGPDTAPSVAEQASIETYVAATPALSPAAIHCLASGARVWVLNDGSDLCSLVMRVVKERGGKPRLVDLEYLDRIEDPAAPDGVIALAPPYATLEEGREHLLNFFNLCTFLAKRFEPVADDGKRRFVAAVTRMGGRFGMAGIDAPAACYYGGLSGVLKSAAHEWPAIACHVIDLANDLASSHELAGRIVDACLCDGPVEIGLLAEHACGVELQRCCTQAGDTEGPSPLGLGDVVLVTGGARGVTAALAIELADQCQPTMLVLGRSPEPVGEEPIWLAAAADEASIKVALLAHATTKVTPAQVDRQVEKVRNEREMAQTLAQIRRAGAVVIYRSVDVQDRQVVMDVVREIRENVGPIRGIVHGAGVLRDRLLKDKTSQQVQEVMATKVDGFHHIMDAVNPDELRLIALFSSSSARFGRRGQTDYAAANEILNKLARYYAGRLAHCRVMALGFGPWEGGMVTPALARVFQAEGIGLIPLQAGARHVANILLGRTACSAAEMVIMAGGQEKVKQVPVETLLPVPSALFSWEIGLTHQPVLAHHVIGGSIVVPVVLLAEWLGHAALHANPGLIFHGFDDLRVLKGIVLGPEEARTAQAYALVARQASGFYEVYTEIRSIDRHGAQVRHASCKVILAEQLPAPVSRRMQLTFAAPYARPTEQVYEEMLFHGEELRGIERIFGVDHAGCAIHARVAPPPAKWLEAPLRGHWLADPLVLDSAFQAVVLWTRECAASASLPCAIRYYRQYCTSFPQGGCLVEWSARRHGDKLVTADGEFTDAHGTVMARMENYEAVMDPSLNDAFRRRSYSKLSAAAPGRLQVP